MASDAPPRKARRRADRSPLQKLFYWTLVLGVWGGIFLVTVLIVFAMDLPDTSKLDQVERQPSVSFLDRSGALLSVRGSRYAPPADLDALPKYVPDAFVAVEDQTFYWNHLGFNPWGIVRSQIYNIQHRNDDVPLRGGSTITQQLARNLFLSLEQTYRRKIQELILSMWLELRYSKKEILALYLNRMDFGNGAFGIEAAAQRYFNTSADRLTLQQTALLAGMLKGPSRYSPIAHPERAGARAAVVLDTMVKTRKITDEQRIEALSEPLKVSRSLANQNAQYFVDWVNGQVLQILGGEPSQDLIVETTLDLPIQMAAESAVRDAVNKAKGRGVEQAALVALDGEGRIRAYVGGVNYQDSQYDRASLANRQAGSSFKPFVYLTAMEQNHTPYETVVDEPITIGNWSPRNYEGTFSGPMSLQNALTRSVNTVAAKLASEVGTGNVASTARRLGITNKIQLDPSMALGAVEVTPIQMAQAYAAFSNGGYKVSAYGISRIRTADGELIYDASLQQPPRRQVIGTPALQYMNQMLRQVPLSGTGTAARVGGADIAGKTGTTSDYRDAWYVGYTGGFVAAVWVGRDDNTPMKGVTGGSTPAQIWGSFMTRAIPRLAVEEIPGGPAPGPPEETGPIDMLGNLVDSLTGIGGLINRDQNPPPEREPPTGPPGKGPI